jgi:hypothetical protein
VVGLADDRRTGNAEELFARAIEEDEAAAVSVLGEHDRRDALDHLGEKAVARLDRSAESRLSRGRLVVSCGLVRR